MRASHTVSCWGGDDTDIPLNKWVGKADIRVRKKQIQKEWRATPIQSKENPPAGSHDQAEGKVKYDYG
ncbi:hypothetical protein [Bacteroides nordii]|uniref:hypothetical protein n=1 Tax=Bacteroides nordii TaxID=291645 RepID=UPI002491C614|nr:hypothetical protein [Bacteroides nordii]